MRSQTRAKGAREVLRLVGELYELVDDPTALFAHMHEGVVRFAGADGTIVVKTRGFACGAAVPIEPLIRGFTCEAERAVIMHGCYDSVLTEPGVAAMARLYTPGRAITRYRAEVVSDAVWNASDYGVEVRRVAGVSDIIYSFAPGGSADDPLGLGIFRAGGSRFGDAERDLVQMFQEGMAPLYRWLVPRPLTGAALAAARLRPSHKATLRALLTGLADKEIARRLGLSRHTVHEYVNALFAHFGVASRAELLARFIPADAVPD
jgi:DNA-binding CsgD family transcriptional regulator